MRAHQLIKKTRERAQINDSTVAAQAGVTVTEYGDIEQHADEFLTGISLATARAVCKALNLELHDVLAAESLSLGNRDLLPPDIARSPRAALIRSTRQARGISVAELADAIGFASAAIEKAEKDNDFLETLPIQTIADLAERLRLPLISLIPER